MCRFGRHGERRGAPVLGDALRPRPRQETPAACDRRRSPRATTSGDARRPRGQQETPAACDDGSRRPPPARTEGDVRHPRGQQGAPATRAESRSPPSTLRLVARPHLRGIIDIAYDGHPRNLLGRKRSRGERSRESVSCVSRVVLDARKCHLHLLRAKKIDLGVISISITKVMPTILIWA